MVYRIRRASLARSHMMTYRLLSALLIAFGIASSAQAEFLPPDLDKVPVARLVENLEKLAKDKPKDAEITLNLARTYAMAYAKKTDELQVNKRAPDAPWLGYAPTRIPYGKVKTTEDKEKLKAAQASLEKATAWYEATLKIDKDNATARLGLAWITEQAGKKNDAIKLYRALIEDAWDKLKEKDLQVLGITGETVTTEAGGYLLVLLDAEKDKDEITSLKERTAKLKKLPRPITPIAVPLFDGLAMSDLEDREARVKFDADGSGEKKPWTWITPKAAWLVYDSKGKGEVNSGLQFFGSVTFRLFWSNGYAALNSLDDNRDGKISVNELDGLALWHDANGNGVADPGEVRPLADYGIVSLSCQWQVLKDHTDKIAYSPTGVTFKNGKTRPTFDLILRTAK